MNDTHTSTLEAQAYLRKFLADVPPHFRAQFQMWFDCGSVYETIFKGIDDFYNESHEKALASRGIITEKRQRKKIGYTGYRLMHHLVATGKPMPSGCIVVSHPGDYHAVRRLLKCSEKAAREALDWLDDCPLIKPNPNLEKGLRIYSSAGEVPEGDAQSHLSFDDTSDDSAPSNGTELDSDPSHPGAKAPGCFVSPGALAPPDAEQLTEHGALAPQNPEQTTEPGAKAPPLPKVGKYVSNSYLPNSGSDLTREEAKAEWLALGDLPQADPIIRDHLIAAGIFKYRLDALSRCSEITPDIVRQEQTRLGEVHKNRLSHRLRVRIEKIRAKDRLTGVETAQAQPSQAENDGRDYVAEGLAELARLKAQRAGGGS